MKIWFYDCDYGQGCVQATTYEAARSKAILDAGRAANVSNVRLATDEEINFRKAMGGTF